MITLSDTQKRSIHESNARINSWEGAVRSGKTMASIIRFLRALERGPSGDAVIVGVSRDTIQRNVLSEISNLAGIPKPTPKATAMSLCGRTIYLVGANDERSERRIRGSTFALAYVDETTLLPPGVFKMLLSRLSIPGAQCFCTTNPDSPFHWFKTEFLDNQELDLKRFPFRLDDNPSLTKEYTDALKREYQGLWYSRYIEGQWCLAEGTVYSMFDESLHVIRQPPGPAEYYVLGIDYGTTNPTAFCLVGFSSRHHPNIWVEDEYYWDSRKQGRQKTDTEYAEDLRAFIKGRNVRAVYIDPAAASLRLELQRNGIMGIMDADNDVLNGISYVSNVISNGTLKVVRDCKHVIQEFQTYRWDESASRRGVDKPIKDNDHILDALRYAVFTHFPRKLGTSVTKDDVDRAWGKACGYEGDLPPFFRKDYAGQAGGFNQAGRW